LFLAGRATNLNVHHIKIGDLGKQQNWSPPINRTLIKDDSNLACPDRRLEPKAPSPYFFCFVIDDKKVYINPIESKVIGPIPPGPRKEKMNETGKGDTQWETKARRIRTRVRNRRQTNRTKKPRISWPSNPKENLEQ
jgi:hypothetical protein